MVLNFWIEVWKHKIIISNNKALTDAECDQMLKEVDLNGGLYFNNISSPTSLSYPLRQWHAAVLSFLIIFLKRSLKKSLNIIIYSFYHPNNQIILKYSIDGTISYDEFVVMVILIFCKN